MKNVTSKGYQIFGVDRPESRPFTVKDELATVFFIVMLTKPLSYRFLFDYVQALKFNIWTRLKCLFKLPPLNSRPKSPVPIEQKVVKTVVKNSVKKNNQVVVEKISHIKQHSIDSGVGSQMGSSHGIIPNGSSNTLRTRPVSLSNSQKIQHVRSISENALLTSPQFSIYEKVHI